MLYETDEARIDEKPIVETAVAGDTNPFPLLIFSSFDSFQNNRVSWLTLRIISWLNQWLAFWQCGLTRGNPSHHAGRYQQAAIFDFVIPAIFLLSYLCVCGMYPSEWKANLDSRLRGNDRVYSRFTMPDSPGQQNNDFSSSTLTMVPEILGLYSVFSVL